MLNKDYQMYEMHKKLILYEIWEEQNLYNMLYTAPSSILHLALYMKILKRSYIYIIIDIYIHFLWIRYRAHI